MGSKTFDGVRFSAFVDDHPPPNIHGHYAGIMAVVDLLQDERAVRLSRRKKSVRPSNAKQSDINHILSTAQRHFDELIALWESANDK